MSQPHPPLQLEWDTTVPAGWDVRPLGRDVWVRARLGWKGLTASEYVDHGYPMLATPNIKGPEIDYARANRISKARFDESPEIILRNGDVLLTKDGSTIGTVNVVRRLPTPATVNGSIALLTPTGDLEGRFLYWFIASGYAQAVFDRLREGMGVPHLFQRDINRIRMPHPPIDEQRAIADYLDHEIAQIDTLIGKQERLIATLQERRHAVVSRALAGHPATRLRRLVDPRRPMSYGILQAGESVPDGVPYIGPSDMPGRGESPSLESLRRTSREIAAAYSRSILDGGDLVVSIGPAYGKVALIADDLTGTNLTQDTVRVACIRRLVDPRYLVWVLTSVPAQDYWDSEIQGATFRRLNLGTLARTPIPLPPLDEQHRIAARLDDQTAKIDMLINKTERFIELAKERRTALITAAVTGQIDVQAAA